MSSIALVDCNNFFVSCERLFNPKLWGRPVVVLSNNDGCIIARSLEAKRLHIPMGAPFFEWAEVIARNHVVTLSSNFSLYGDLSGRVMATLETCGCPVEVYSIDEAFLHLETREDPLSYCAEVRKRVMQWTGIPVSIGLAPTKTLAKIAGDLAKHAADGLCSLLDSKEREKILRTLPVEEVWGIGGRMKVALEGKGIFTAHDFCTQEEAWIRKHFSVMALRTALELRGEPCIAVEETPSPKKSMMTSRTFQRPLFSKEELQERIASFAARGGEKLREQGSFTSSLHLFIHSSTHKEGAFYSNQATFLFPEPTDYTPDLLQAAMQCLDRIYRKGVAYKRGGVLLSGIVQEVQKDLFSSKEEKTHEKQRVAIDLMDLANRRFGYPILHFAAEGKREVSRENPYRSPCYTTRWDELLTVRV